MKSKLIILLLLLIIAGLVTVIIFDYSKQSYKLCKTDDGFSMNINIENVCYKLDFYPNGHIKKISQKDSVSDVGLQQSFYENGQLFFSTSIDENKLPVGDQVLFNSNGTIQKIERLINISNTISMLEKINFLETGVSVNSSYFFTFYIFELEKDAVKKRFLKITYNSNEEIRPIYFRFGIYDNDWNITDSTNITIVDIVDNSCVLDFDEFEKYGDTLRGELKGITCSNDTFFTPVEYVW